MGASRNQRRLAKKAQAEGRAARWREWPAFLIDTEDGDSQFVDEIKKAIQAFSFEELPTGQQRAYRDVARYGAEDTLRHIQAGANLARTIDPTCEDARHVLSHWALTLGELVFAHIPEAVRKTLLPYNDARFIPLGNDIVVHCRSLVKVATGKKPFWYSRQKPTVQIGEKTYVVAFSDHAVDQIKRRINPDWTTYAGLGDVYAYLEQCTRFDVCRLLNVGANGERQLAVTFYDICANEEFWEWLYVTRVLGEQNLNPALGQPYHRLGYCPAFLDDASGFIKLGTLLCPGYRATPEYGLLMESDLPPEEKARLEGLAVEHNRTTLLDKMDFSAIKWFHDHGVEQVIQTTDCVYRPLPKDRYVITTTIRK